MLAPQKGQDVSTGGHLPKLLAQGFRFGVQEHLHDLGPSLAGNQGFQAARKWSNAIAEFVNTTSTVKCPVVAENFDRAARDERRPPGQSRTMFFEPSDY